MIRGRTDREELGEDCGDPTGVQSCGVVDLKVYQYVVVHATVFSAPSELPPLPRDDHENHQSAFVNISSLAAGVWR
jgi:hypothetical protein